MVPAVAEVEKSYKSVQEGTFAPILYLIKYRGEVDNALALHHDVAQGLSSAIFTENLCEAELFLSAAGSDCGLAKVNIATSGAEIGVLLEAKRKPVVVGSSAQMHGRNICVGKPIPF